MTLSRVRVISSESLNVSQLTRVYIRRCHKMHHALLHLHIPPHLQAVVQLNDMGTHFSMRIRALLCLLAMHPPQVTCLGSFSPVGSQQ